MRNMRNLTIAVLLVLSLSLPAIGKGTSQNQKNQPTAPETRPVAFSTLAQKKYVTCVAPSASSAAGANPRPQGRDGIRSTSQPRQDQRGILWRIGTSTLGERRHSSDHYKCESS